MRKNTTKRASAQKLKVAGKAIVKKSASEERKKMCGQNSESTNPISIDTADMPAYTTNVCLNKIKGKIHIPCGIGNTDFGFYICGINEKKCSTAPTVFALIYNYLTRNSRIKPGDYPHGDYPRYLKDKTTTFQLNYQNIFRLMMIILQLIKNDMGLARTKTNLTRSEKTIELNISYSGKAEELNIATEIINDYIARFSRLMRVEKITLKNIARGPNSIKVSLGEKTSGVYVENKTEPSNARELWYGEKINYRLDTTNIEDLEYILSEISPFNKFKDGQFDALKKMLGTNEHTICIMPTGSGKSLIFYIASLLQPLPIFVLVPTDILIKDQIRNLKNFHHIDNVSHLKLTPENDFKDFEMRNSLLYLTPLTFQNGNLLRKFRQANKGETFEMDEKSRIFKDVKVAPGSSIAYIVLDEIHCLSNWGHDFRPEYLMLAKELKKYLDRVTYLGFTATADYTIAKDIQQQLDISNNNIFTPVAFEKYNVSYHFQAFFNFDQMRDKVCEIVSEQISKDERILIFTKSDRDSSLLAQAIGYEADIFRKDDDFAYTSFADGKCKVLVACEDLGIGINLPNVQNVIHFGLPLSKCEFVQEIGRAGRADEAVTSYVLYLEPSPRNIPPALLERKSEISNISEMLKGFDNDYSACYRKLSSNINSKRDLRNNVMRNYYWLEEKGGYGNPQKEFPLADVEMNKKYIFMLYAIGYIREWYVSSHSDLDHIKLTVEISGSTGHRQDPMLLNHVKECAVKYYENLDSKSTREQIGKTKAAKDVLSVIDVYVDWYYTKYLYHHREMFLDFFRFVEGNKKCDSNRITEELGEYFILPFDEIERDAMDYSKRSLKEIANKVARGIGRNTRANVERINNDIYIYKLDCVLFLDDLRCARFDKSRFTRIIKNTPTNQNQELMDAIRIVFARLDTSSRFETICGLIETTDLFGNDWISICSSLYENANKDSIYYGLLATALNRRNH